MVTSNLYFRAPKKALTISGLKFSYQKDASLPVLNDISLSVRAGEIISVLGKSGCGKSTRLNLIAGLMKPIAGEISINHDKSRCNIGYIFQEDALMPWRTVKANLALAQEIGKVPHQQWQVSLMDLLSRFHLSENILEMYPTQLSGGMRQRVSIIQSLLFNPQLLLLDEPFSALDFCTKLRLEGEFYRFIKDTYRAAVLVTHDIEEAIALSDRVIILNNNGTIEADISVTFDYCQRDPESIRGVAEFGEHYRLIWAKLKAVISQ
ncbi:MAG: ATP-binding cassette domain-containing protein [Candidatus Obscuribacterales bacterium]|nr:ATP-binding cassette domain-containing protein [Candidatus Obscuribacterales bacterium]